MGRIIIVSFFCPIDTPAAWSDSTIVTGLPIPSSIGHAWAACTMQESADSARYVAHVNSAGKLIISNKSSSSGGNWVAFSMTYVAAK